MMQDMSAHSDDAEDSSILECDAVLLG